MASSSAPTEASVPSPVLPTTAVDFVNKVKVRYESKPTVYQSFLAIFKKFQDQQCFSKHMPFVDKRNAVNEIYFEVLTLFEDSDDLAEEFRNYMMSGDGTDSGDFLGARRQTRNKSSASTTPITISTSKRRASTKPSTSDDVSHRAAPSSTFALTTQLSVQKRGDFIKPTIPSTPKYPQSSRSSTLTSRIQRQIQLTPKRPESMGSTKTSGNTTPRSAHTSTSSFRNPSTSAHLQSKSGTTDVLSTILSGTVYTPTPKPSTSSSTLTKDSSTIKARESKEHTPSRVLLSKSGTITLMSSAPNPFESSSSEGTAQFPNPSTAVTKPQTFPTPNSSVYGSVNPRSITGPKVSTAQPLSHSTHPYKSASSSKQKGRGSIKSATARSKRASTLKPTIPQSNPLHPFNPSTNMYASENPLSISGQKVPTTQKLPLSAKSDKPDSSSNQEGVESVPTSPIKSDKKRKRKSSTCQSSKRVYRTSIESDSSASDGSTGGNERPTSGDKRSSRNSSTATSQLDNLPYSDMNISSSNKSSTHAVEHVPAQSLSFQTNMFGPNYEQMSSDSLLVILANVAEVHGNLMNRSMGPSGSSTFKFTGNRQTVSPSLDRSYNDMNIFSGSNFLTQMGSTFDNIPSSRRSSFSTFTASPPSHSLSESDLNISSGSNSPIQSWEHVPAQSLSFQTNLFYDELSSDSSLALLANVSEVYRNLMNRSLTPSGKLSFKAMENPQIASPNDDLIVIDHTELERVGPSYLKFSNNDKCSGRNVLGDRVLNDTLAVCCADDFQIKEIEHDTSVHELFRIENERANLDHVIETTRSTMEHLSVILAQVRKMFKVDSDQLDENLNGRSGVIYRQAIRRIYGEKHFARIYLDLRTLPMQIIPRVLRRLGEKLDEWKEAQKDFFKNWRKQTETVYLKSLDVRGVTFREEDAKLLQRESLLREMQNMFQRGQANGGAQIQLIKEYPLEYFIEVASELIMHYVRMHDSFQLRQEQEIDVMLSQYIPDLLLKRKYQTEESKIFHANDNWYCFFRMYILLCERLRHMQNVVLELVQSENDELEQQKEKCANSGLPFIPKENEGVPTSDYLVCLVVLVKMKLDKKLTVEEYKNELQDKFGNKAYTAYSLDLIVHNIVVELLQLANERNPVNCRSLFDLSQEAISAASYSVDFMKQKVDLYEQCAKLMITADHVIKIVFDKVNGRVSFEYKHNPTHPYIPRQ